MSNPLYSPILSERLSATLEFLKKGQTAAKEYYPEGLRNAANAYAVLVGPSYGAYNGCGEKYAGGPNRPISTWSKRVIGNGLGLRPFPDGSEAREKRWEKLLLACLGSAEAVNRLSALYNLDWGHFPNQADVPESNLEQGTGVVVKYLILARPKIIVPLTKKVWNHLVPALIASGAAVIQENVIPEHQSIIIRLKSQDEPFEFDTLVARPYNHPSRHFLTEKRILDFGRGISAFIGD